MVSRDKLFDDIGQIVFICQFDALGHMADNHLSAVDSPHLLMWIYTRLVFCEVYGIDDLTDIMVHGSCTYQLTLASNLIGNLCCQVTNLNRMLECARCHFTHFPEKRFVHIRQFDKGDVGCEPERLFYQIE